MAVIVTACVVMVAVADQAPVYHAPPAYGPPPSYHAPQPYHQPEYPEVPPKYTYNYGVADEYSGANFGHSEVRDGYKTEGSYTVNLPDGRKQTVTYVDNGDGLEAVVTYEGEAQYPEHQPSYSAPPAPYAPLPAYEPAPAYPAPPTPTYA
ncbi:Pro-resilin-like 138 [Homarus americanus]|uniref:Pro-resilin-like 138 n=1 Tax=Homarus americanus TaxID=6706 RepID=A0A8J5K9J5_HOMAM|nr:Pro-resilin-like 138 [Homarus americanus]